MKSQVLFCIPLCNPAIAKGFHTNKIGLTLHSTSCRCFCAFCWMLLPRTFADLYSIYWTVAVYFVRSSGFCGVTWIRVRIDTTTSWLGYRVRTVMAPGTEVPLWWAQYSIPKMGVRWVILAFFTRAEGMTRSRSNNR